MHANWGCKLKSNRIQPEGCGLLMEATWKKLKWWVSHNSGPGEQLLVRGYHAAVYHAGQTPVLSLAQKMLKVDVFLVITLLDAQKRLDGALVTLQVLQ